MTEVFISYCHKDANIAKRIDQYLTYRGFNVWRDDRLGPGVKFEGEIQRQLKDARICLFLLSKPFISSEYCQNEVGFAEACSKPFFILKIQKCRPKGFLATRSLFDYSKGFYEDSYIKGKLSLSSLIEEIRKELRESILNDMRSEFIDFFERQLFVTHHLKNDHKFRLTTYKLSSGITNIAHEENILLDYDVFVTANRRFIDHLRSSNSITSMFIFDLPKDLRFRLGDTWLPGWIIECPIIEVNSGTLFQIIPNFIILQYGIFEQEDIIEALVCIPQESCSSPKDKQSSNLLDWVYTSISYQEVTDINIAQQIGLSRATSPDKVKYVFILTKGIFRISLVSNDKGRVKVTFTKYFGIEAARAKLSGMEYSVEAKKPEILQLFYLGYRNKFARGGILSFFLLNCKKSIAIIRELKVLIHSVTIRTPQPPPGDGAGVPQYTYSVELKPTDQEVLITENGFKYGPGEIDKFIIDFTSSVPGYDYEISIVVDWVDVETGKISRLKTPREIVPFPKYRGN